MKLGRYCVDPYATDRWLCQTHYTFKHKLYNIQNVECPGYVDCNPAFMVFDKWLNKKLAYKARKLYWRFH